MTRILDIEIWLLGQRQLHLSDSATGILSDEMAPTKQPKLPAKSAITTFDTNSASGCFVALKLRGELLKRFGPSDVQVNHHIQRPRNQKIAKELGIGIVVPPQDPPEMHTRGAWDKNLANPNRVSESPVPDVLGPTATNNRASPAGRANGGRVSKPKGGRKPKSTSVKRQPTSPTKRVSFSQTVDVLESTDSSCESSAEPEPAHETDKENEMAGKPKLNLKLSIGGAPTPDPSQTPGPQSAQRTPSIKLTYKGGSLDGVARPNLKRESPDPIALEPSSKKRKTTSIAEKSIIHPPPVPLRKLTFTNIKKPEQQAQTLITPGGLKLKTKGKVPKRPLGVGYDSELDEREADPVILEGFILRMLPGPDCDYVRDAIEKGTLGVSRMQGGANVNMRFLDTQGRRGMINVNGHHYATSLVDLPCIIEGMKSWDKKGFIKSIDICQMLLVLGPCKTDEEAKLYPLPHDVNPHNYQYAHGITAPMHWVRKRRFARFKRARVDDVEAVDRKVHAMLEADAKADEVDYQVTDRDPRLDEPQYSGTEEEDSDDEEEDEGEEEDADGEPEDYFAEQNGTDGFDETPGYAATPQDEIGDEEVNDFERMFAEEEENAAVNGAPTHDPFHLAPDAAGDSSFAVTSASASPSAAAVDTPASGVSANQTSDDEDDDDDEERDEDAADDDESTQQVKERIQDLEERIKEQTETLKRTQNTILRRKIAGKIAELKGDVSTMKRSIGLGEAKGDEDEE